MNDLTPKVKKFFRGLFLPYDILLEIIILYIL